MDVDLLSEKGVKFNNPRIGHLEHYALVIGNRASLIPRENSRAYGVLMTVDKESMDALYSEPSVMDYKSEPVDVTIQEKIVSAQCYNLPPESMSGTNPEYAKALLALATNLGFPADYLQVISEMAS